jgi:outer membrane immunogenic protein
MKRLLVVALASLSIGAADVFAADIAPATYTKAPAAVAEAYDWAGFYIGGGVGWRKTESAWTTTQLEILPAGIFAPNPSTASAGLSSDGIRGALHAGYNWRVTSLIWGIEADVGYASNKRTLAGFPGTNPAPAVLAASTDRLTAETTWDGSVRLRGGLLVSPSLLLYATGGLALQQATLSMTCANAIGGSVWCGTPHSESASKTLVGWTAGGGIEAAVAKNWFVRGEYRYSDVGRFSHTFFGSAPIDTIIGGATFKTHIVNLGVSYKFGSPVVARY